MNGYQLEKLVFMIFRPASMMFSDTTESLCIERKRKGTKGKLERKLFNEYVCDFELVMVYGSLICFRFCLYFP